MTTASGGPTRPLTRGERIWLTIVYWGLVAACVLFALVGWRLVHSQEAPLKGVLPVTAKIIRSDVVAHKDAQGHTLEQPIVMYSYQVDSVHYSTDRVTLREASRSGHWAKDVAARFHAGRHRDGVLRSRLSRIGVSHHGTQLAALRGVHCAGRAGDSARRALASCRRTGQREPAPERVALADAGLVAHLISPPSP